MEALALIPVNSEEFAYPRLRRRSQHFGPLQNHLDCRADGGGSVASHQVTEQVGLRLATLSYWRSRTSSQDPSQSWFAARCCRDTRERRRSSRYRLARLARGAGGMPRILQIGRAHV